MIALTVTVTVIGLRLLERYTENLEAVRRTDAAQEAASSRIKVSCLVGDDYVIITDDTTGKLCTAMRNAHTNDVEEQYLEKYSIHVQRTLRTPCDLNVCSYSN